MKPGGGFELITGVAGSPKSSAFASAYQVSPAGSLPPLSATGTVKVAPGHSLAEVVAIDSTPANVSSVVALAGSESVPV